MSRSTLTVLLAALLALGIFIAWPIGIVDAVFLCIYVLGGLWSIRSAPRR